MNVNVLLIILCLFVTACTTHKTTIQTHKVESTMYYYLVKKGSIQIAKENHIIDFVCVSENKTCHLTSEDTKDIINTLTNVSTEIWHDASYQKQNNQQTMQYKDGFYTWNINGNTLMITSDGDDTIIRYTNMSGSNNGNFKLSVNNAVEIIQILEQL